MQEAEPGKGQDTVTTLAEWMRGNSTNLTGLAAQIGVHISRLSRMCSQETMPTRHHAALVRLGVPASLLPRPEDKKSGPKSRPAVIPNDEAMKAFRG